MIGFLARRPRKPVPYRPRLARPFLERLETRDCPSAPVITALTATTLPGRVVRLSGTLTADNTATVNVSFSGAASGSTTANQAGQFSFTTSTASLGTVNAVAVDSQFQMSSIVSATITDTAPTLTLSITYGSLKTVTLSGKVTDVDGGLTVTFSGAVTGSVISAADGTFSLTTQATRLGTVTAAVTDLWNRSGSTTASVSVAAPQIFNFTATHETGNTWVFQGQITDKDTGLVVTFGGLPEVENQTATESSSTYFILIVQLQPGETGTVTAQTVDCWGQSSNEALALVN